VRNAKTATNRHALKEKAPQFTLPEQLDPTNKTWTEQPAREVLFWDTKIGRTTSTSCGIGSQPIKDDQCADNLGPQMKNIQVIDGALNAAYDIFAATDEEFAMIFPAGEDVAFIDEVIARGPTDTLDDAFDRIWKRRIPKKDVLGIHGLLFYELEHKKQYYPTRRDEEARNPDSTRLR